MNTPYSALAVANYFLDLAKSKGQSLSPMKLQKLIYFAHGWHLALYKQPLVNEEVQAWDYGPVIASVYHEFKQFGGGSIEGLADDFDMDEFEIVTPRVPLEDKKTTALLNKVWSVYGEYTGIQLSNLTHAEGSAWTKARKDKPGLRSIGISNDLIQREFAEKLTK